MLQWLVLPAEGNPGYTHTNFGDKRPGDASQVIDWINFDSAHNKGHTDWRLPTIKELHSLVGSPHAPKKGWFWSSTPYEDNNQYAYYVCFGGIGHIQFEHRNADGLQVRLVRTNNQAEESA